MKILWIEPDVNQIDLFRPKLLAKKHSVMIAYDGRIGWKLLKDQVYDLLILTPELPGITGYELTRSIRYKEPTIPILMLGTPGYLDQESRSLQAGATYFLNRPVDENQLLTSIQTVHLYDKNRPSQWIGVQDLVLNLTERTVYRDGCCINLTERECHLLAVLMQSPGQVISKEVLLERVWTTTNHHRLNTVEVYINLLRKKIDQNFSPKLIQTVLGGGYMIASLNQITS